MNRDPEGLTVDSVVSREQERTAEAPLHFIKHLLFSSCVTALASTRTYLPQWLLLLVVLVVVLVAVLVVLLRCCRC